MRGTYGREIVVYNGGRTFSLMLDRPGSEREVEMFCNITVQSKAKRLFTQVDREGAGSQWWKRIPLHPSRQGLVL